jgi:hypothetical protein
LSDAVAAVKTAAGIHNQSETVRMEERADISSKNSLSIETSKQIGKAVATASCDSTVAVKAAAGIHEQSEIETMEHRANIASKGPSSIQSSKQLSKAVATATRDAAATVKAAAGIHEQSEIERMEERANIASKSPSAILIYRIPVDELESLRIFENLNEERIEDWLQVVQYYR